MVQPTQPPAQGVRPVYRVSTEVYRDQLPEDPQPGDRISSKLIYPDQPKNVCILVVCDDINKEFQGCGIKRWVQYQKLASIRRLCMKCNLTKQKTM